MTVEEFIKNFVCDNTLVRFWTRNRSGFTMLHEGDDDVTMEWKVLSYTDIWQHELLNRKVIGVADIIVNGFNYPEAVNIVIE